MERKNHLLPNVSFLDEFSQYGDQKTCHTTYTKALLVKKHGTELPYVEEKIV